ncbi:acyl-CoA thioesterase [Streptomyces sp. NPDC059740]|uniref:acyl-CoA thioesterase n=1 Tax=Streptomyces sp. NPDC059740 TaxID=3346926 RepID=UPI00365000B4
MTVEAVQPTAPTVPYGRLVPVTVHFDELDALGMLHNSRFPLHVERAFTQYWSGQGFRFEGDWEAAGDMCNVVKDLHITYEQPVHLPGEYAVHVWVEELGRTSLTYGFRFCSADGGTTHALGRRVLVRVDARTRRPTPWSEHARAVAGELLRHEPAATAA